MQIVLSGLDRRVCSGFQVDESFKWLSLDDLQAALKDPGEHATPCHVLWLYQSPVLSGRDFAPDELADHLDHYHRWMEANRSALNLRPRLGNQLTFVNVDRVAASWVQSEFGLSVVPDGTVTPAQAGAVADDPGVSEIAEYLLAWGVPRLWEVYEALESVSSGSEIRSSDRLRLTPVEEDVFHVVGRLAASLRKSAGGRPGADLTVAHEQISAGQNDAGEEVKPAQHDPLLLKHLLSLQEELERYYGQSRGLAESERRLRKEHEAVCDEREALRQQLEQLQDEVIALATRMPTPVQQTDRSLGRRFVSYVPNRIRARRERARQREERLSQLALIGDSGLFDREWYLRSYPDVDEAGMDPAEHYLEFGWREGRNPGPAFSTRFYLTTYPDVLSSGMNPLLHYVMHGRSEGRSARKES